jgi:hypothetical protein
MVIGGGTLHYIVFSWRYIVLRCAMLRIILLGVVLWAEKRAEATQMGIFLRISRAC